MLRCLIVLALLTIGVGCKSTVDSTKSAQLDSIKKRYVLVMKFASLEDVKRVPYQLKNLKMELLEEVSSAENIYQVSILCKEHALIGTLEKLNAHDGISWTKPVD